MRGCVLGILYTLIDDIAEVKSVLDREYCSVDYTIEAILTSGGGFRGVKSVSFLLSSRRDYYKTVFPEQPYIVQHLRSDIERCHTKRRYKFLRVDFVKQRKCGIDEYILKLWY